MLNSRQNRILKLLGSNEQASVLALSEKLNVSAVTIRQDLSFLEKEGLLKRVHGGAVLRDADDIENRLAIRYDQKLRIARRLAETVREGESVLIESGSANALLARELMKKSHVRIVTTNVHIARQFRKNDGASVILLGGIYQHESESLVGPMTRYCIDQIHLDKAFIGIDGYTKESGFTSRDLFRAEISAYIIKKARESCVVSDSSKFGKTGLATICRAADVKFVATDSALEEKYHNELLEQGVHLILA